MNFQDGHGFSALEFALQLGLEEVTLTLIKHGADVKNADWPPLSMAAYYGHVNLVSLLLDNRLSEVNENDTLGWTALHHAASNGCSKVVTLLLNNGAEIDVQGDSGESALIFAAKHGFVEVVTILVEAGADVSLLDKKEYSALMYSVELGHGKIAAALLEYGANINRKFREVFNVDPVYIKYDGPTIIFLNQIVKIRMYKYFLEIVHDVLN